MPASLNIALDATARTIDVDGRLHISKSHISKACVNPYYGREIPKNKELGLDPDKIYYLLRDPKELAKAAPTFERLPILGKHVPISADSIPTDLIVGSIGSEVEFNFPYLDADLCFWTSESIAGIESKQVRELSCAYRYVAIMVPGVYEGQSYDGVMTEIIGNHLAQVESGRAGSDVFAADSQMEIPKMNMTKLGKSLVTALGAISPVLAADASFPALVGELTRKTFKKAEILPKLIAMDAECAEKAETVMDGFEEETEPKEKAKDKKAKDSKGAKDSKAKDAKPEGAEDADEDDDEAPAQDAEKDEKAMDAKIQAFKHELREADVARRAVQPIVGDVIAQDSAEEIYGFALDHMKVDHAGANLAGKKALFTLAAANATKPAPVVIAQDSAGAAKMFPQASRFVQG